MIIAIFDFNACSVTASTVFYVLSLAALLRALFFAFYRLQRYCEHCFLRFIVCSVTASIVFCVSMLAALLRALFFAFYRLQRYCEHCFLHFSACSVTASIKTFIFTLAERRCAFGMVRAAPVCPPERPRSGVSIPKYICASRIMDEDLTMDAPLRGALAGTQARPLPLLQRNYSFSFLIYLSATGRTLRPSARGIPNFGLAASCSKSKQ